MGMLVLKASTYKVIEENSKYEDSWFYSLEKRGRKSFFRIFNQLGSPDLPVPEGNGEKKLRLKGIFVLFSIFDRLSLNFQIMGRQSFLVKILILIRFCH